jgi:4-amino-4-deoxy-L-arabinose transferase-like glycosyltransferase
LHFLAVCLIFYFLKKITIKSNLSFVLSLFFLVHPALVQAIAWVPGRNDSLLTILIIAAFLFLIEFSEKHNLKSFLAYFIFLLLALLTKEVAIFFPFVAIIYFLTIGKKNKLTSADKLLLFSGSVLAFFIWFLMRKLALDGGAPLDLNLVINNLPTAFAMAFKMMGQAILPFNLAVINTNIDSSIIYSLIILPVLIITLIFSHQKRNNYILFGAFWFLLFFLVPFLFSDASSYLSHRSYLALVGILIILSEIDFIKKLDWSKKIVQTVTITLLIVFFILSYRHSLNFKDPASFWESAVISAPHSALAHNNLGLVYFEQNNTETAMSEYSKALLINPGQRTTHYNMGIAYLAQNNLNKAKYEFEEEFKNNPNNLANIEILNNIKNNNFIN